MDWPFNNMTILFIILKIVLPLLFNYDSINNRVSCESITSKNKDIAFYALRTKHI